MSARGIDELQGLKVEPAASDEEQASGTTTKRADVEPAPRTPLRLRWAAVVSACVLVSATVAIAGIKWQGKAATAEVGEAEEAPEWVDLWPASWTWPVDLNHRPGPFLESDPSLSNVWPAWPKKSQELRRMKCIESKDGTLSITLKVEEAWLEVPEAGVRVRTRLFNKQYPGPLLCIKRGDLVVVRLRNNLGRSVLPEELMMPRREGQQTPDEPWGIPPSDAQFQDVGQGVRNPFQMQGHANNFHKANVVNLHTHGLHVSQQEPQDNVLDVHVAPGEEYTYQYQIPHDHSSGNAWYHTHIHGSVTLQVGGGLIGGLVVMESPGELPEWLAKVKPIHCVLHELALTYFGPHADKFAPNDPFKGCLPFGSNYTYACAVEQRMGLLANLSGDQLYKMQYRKGYGFGHGQRNPVTHFFALNGQLSPSLCADSGEWVRLGMTFGSSSLPVNLVLVAADAGGNDDGCRMYLLSKDTAWVSPAPRPLLKGAWIAPGGRCELLLRCHVPGKYALRNNMSYFRGTPNQQTSTGDLDQQVVLHLNVKGKPTAPIDLASQGMVFTPVRPRYLNDLSQATLATPKVPQPAANLDSGVPVEVSTPFPLLEDDGLTITMLLNIDNPHLWAFDMNPKTAFLNQPQRYTVNNMTFNMKRPAAFLEIATVTQMRIRGLGQHAFHMHTYPIQFQSFGRQDYKDFWGGYYEVGDWGDTVQLFNYQNDFNADEMDPIFSALVRFQTDCFKGPAIIHCHVLYHEDAGMMTYFDVWGEQYTTNPRFANQGVYKELPPQCADATAKCSTPLCPAGAARR